MDHRNLQILRLFYDGILKFHIMFSLNLFALQYDQQIHAPTGIRNAENLPEVFVRLSAR